MKKELEFEINNGSLIVGDDNICINTIKMIAVGPSFMREGQYALQVYTTSMILELYYTGSSNIVEDALNKLSSEIKKEHPEFYDVAYIHLVNFRNVENLEYRTRLLNSTTRIHFVDGGDLILKSSKDEFDKINKDFEEYNVQNINNTNI